MKESNAIPKRRSTTVRRDKLMRDIAKGLYVAKCDYRYTDDYAFDNANGFGKTDWKEAVIKRPSENHRNDVIALPEYYFEGSGCAWRNNDDTVNLSVHSNKSYTLKLKSHFQMSYEEFKAKRADIHKRIDAANKKRDEIVGDQKLAMGLTPDHIKESAAFRIAKNEFDLVFKELQDLNRFAPKEYLKRGRI